MYTNSEVSLDALAHRIRDEHAQAEASARDALEHAIAAGQLLIQARAVVGHGGWLPWLEKNCPFSRRTAQAYTLLARKASTLLRGDAQRVAHLSVRSALALLAEPKGTGADKFQPGQKRAAAEKPSHLEDQQLSPAVAVAEDGHSVGQDDAAPLDEILALRQAVERQLPIGSAFFLLLTGPIEPVAQALVEELVALGNRFGWIVSASDGVRMLIGRAPWGQLDSRSAVEGEAPLGDADAHSPSSPNVAAPSITDPDEIDLT